ncbi:centromere protein I-like isoform X1 [Pieris brassicae]|uniref:centromere protein I-like isoform X1 n=1 Tax=Pieris brassicae TaxID=7116 RepID=UPI001E661C5B|nr:centromere protein I-like isoform X1 [Pieris brassicae]
MTDVEEIIDYIKSLKKGFDKELFECKLEELAYVAQNTGLDDANFHILFKLWLNLNIPIRKWMNLGCCIIPQQRVGQNSVEYALRWLLANNRNPIFHPRICFVLDWLTVAMDTDSIDSTALDMGYVIFYSFLFSEKLTSHVIKLIYVLTKPFDVTRKNVLEILKEVKKREGKKSLVRQLQVLLGLFKTYKPECVPEQMPSVSVHTAFKKLNVQLVERFKMCQIRKNNNSQTKLKLVWADLGMGKTNKKHGQLVPSLEFVQIGSTQYKGKIPQKTHLDFSEPQALLQYSLNHQLSRPARLRALLSNATGHTLLSLTDQHQFTFLVHDLHHVLSYFFLASSSHSLAEKENFLGQLAIFQTTLMQGLPVVTKFLAQFLPFWNEKDYYAEILSLLEWISIDSPEFVLDILGVVTQMCCRAQPIHQCLIIKTVTAMYTNLVYTSTRPKNCFVLGKPTDEKFREGTSIVANSLTDMCNKCLQINPDDIRLVLSGLQALVTCAYTCTQIGRGESVGAVPGMLVLSMPLLNNCALMIDMLADLLKMYKRLLPAYKANHGKDSLYNSYMNVLIPFFSDFVSCLSEEFINNRDKGFVFRNLQPKGVNKLIHLMPDINSSLSVRNHLAFAPYTYMRIGSNKFNDEFIHESVFERLTHLNDIMITISN